MKKRKIDKLNWRKRVKNAHAKATFFIEGIMPNDAKKALRLSLYAFKVQRKYLPIWHSDFLKTFKFFITLYDYERLNRPKKALDIALREIHIQRKNPIRLMQLYREIASIYQYHINNKEKTNFYFQKELDIRLSIIDTTHSSSKVHHDYNNISLLYQKIGNIQQQEAYLLKQIEVLKKFLDEKPSFFCGTIAGIYRQLKMFDISLEYHFMELDYAIRNKDKLLATIYDAIAFDYKNLKNYNKSLEYSLKSIESMIELNGDKRGEYHFLRIFHHRIAETYLEIGENDKARFHLLTSKEYDKKNGILNREEADKLLEKLPF